MQLIVVNRPIQPLMTNSLKEEPMIHTRRLRTAASTIILGAALMVQNPLPACCSGFGIFTQGASALGQADAVIAHSSGPSAIFFNPALINALPGTQLEIGTTLLLPSREFKSAANGSTASTQDTVYYPSSLYASHAFTDKISAGLGIFNPFGLGTQWNDDWEGKYLATSSKIETYIINPVVSYRITPKLSFAAGLDVLYLNATLENKVFLPAPPFPVPLPNANQKFTGDGTGVGYNLGAAYSAGHGITAGVSYRSEIDIDVTGDVTINDPLAGSLLNAAGKAAITLPRQVMAGVAYQPNRNITIETGFRWEDWRSYKQLALVVDGQPSQTYPKNWHSTFAVNVGGSYRLNKTFTLLGGYLYGWDPVPDSTFEPSVPDASTHLLCFGSEITLDKLLLSFSYAYQLQQERTKVTNEYGAIANGSYNADIHLLGLSVGYHF